MNRRRWIVCLLWGCSVLAQALTLPPVQRWSVGDLKVWFAHRPVGFADAQLVLPVGSRDDGEHPGLASMTFAMLNQGAQGLSQAALAEGLDGVGAQLTTGVGRDVSVVHLRSLTDPNAWGKAVSLWVEVLRNPSFPEEGWRKLRRRRLARLEERHDDALALGHDALVASVFGRHPYAHPIVGTPEHLGALKPEQCRRFYQQHVHASGAFLVVVGDLTHDQVAWLAQQVEQSLPKGGEHAEPGGSHVAGSRWDGRVQAVHRSLPLAKTQVGWLVGVAGPTRMQWWQQPAWQVANQLLGGGMGGRLFRRIRQEHGLAYHAASQLEAWDQGGVWWAHLQTRQAQAQAAADQLHAVLREDVRRGFTPAEVRRAVHEVTGQWLLGLSSNLGLLQEYTQLAVLGLEPEALEKRWDALRHVDVRCVNALLQRHWQTPWVDIRVG